MKLFCRRIRIALSAGTDITYLVSYSSEYRGEDSQLKPEFDRYSCGPSDDFDLKGEFYLGEILDFEKIYALDRGLRAIIM